MDYVFTARALASEPSTYPDHQIVHLRVFAIWKGTGVEEFMDVLVASSEGQCGYAFTPGTDYLVFADWYDSTMDCLLNLYRHVAPRGRSNAQNSPA